MPISVAVDGPAGAGKSTISREAAKRLGFIYVDTGAMYRSVAYYALSKGISPSDREKLVPLLGDIDIELKYSDGVQRTFLNGEDVSDKIRTPEISAGASAVSAFPEVRSRLIGLQRAAAERSNVIMDGRDIGTTVLPDADLKIYLTASAEIRAKRRFDELAAKGEETSFDEVLAEINERDRRDMTRDIAPLRQAEDAVLTDTSDDTPEQAVSRLISLIEPLIRKED